MTVLDVLSAEKRSQILAGAAAVFAADGYEGASMARIAQVANVSKGTLYNYFDSKALLFSAYVEDKCDRKLSRIFDGVGEEVDAAAALRAIARRMLELMFSDTGLTIYRVVIADAAKFPELARAFFEAGPARAIRQMAGWIADASRQGLLQVDDPEFAAEQFFALCQTHLGMRRKLLLISNPTSEQIERVVERSVAMFLRTYGPGSDQ